MTVAYDGTEFFGFQKQSSAPTVQGELERAIAVVTGEASDIVGAGRTDAGVHALGQVVHFESNWPGPIDRLAVVLCSKLDRAVVVRHACVAADGFHARYSARFRRYGYSFLSGGSPNPLSQRFAFRTSGSLRFDRMRAAASTLEGVHDFGAFVTGVGSAEQICAVRCVQSVSWAHRGVVWLFMVQADGFLRHMVRNIVGYLLLVGEETMSVEEFARLLEPGHGEKSVRQAPACGLCLLRVGY